MNQQSNPSRAKLSDQALIDRTGKSYDQWFAILDKAGAMEMNHKQIAQYLVDRYGIENGWHFQMLTVVYERERKNRQKHERCDGLYEVSISKTLYIPLRRAYDAWNDVSLRKRWLEEPITVKSATIDKTMRLVWNDNTIVVVAFYDKSNDSDKCQVVVQHQKLKDSAHGEQMKQFWGEKLEALKQLLEN